MQIRERSTGRKIYVRSELVTEKDWRQITSSRFDFNWLLEKEYLIYKIRIVREKKIIGLISIHIIELEYRVEVRLIELSRENKGHTKRYEDVAGNLLSIACRISLELFGELAAISLIPKTVLAKHYISKYAFQPAGRSLIMEYEQLINHLNKYDQTR